MVSGLGWVGKRYGLSGLGWVEILVGWVGLGPKKWTHGQLCVISPYLCNLFEQSLLQGKIPNDWKMSSVTVIHKKGKKNCVENYRPISLTCITCKIMESLVRDHIMHYFKSNNLFSKFQYGFITGRSVSVQLLRVLDDWISAVDKGSQVDIVYTDFEKTFDKISHPNLISKFACSLGFTIKLSDILVVRL